MHTQLTPRERQVVTLMASPETASQADVARALDISDVTVSRHLKKARVQKALEARLEKESDKSLGQLGKLRKVQDRALDDLEELAEGQLDVQTALLLVAKLGEATLTQLKIQELTPTPPARPEAARDRERRRTLRAMRAGAWLLSSRGLLGFLLPQATPVGEHTANVAADSGAK